MKPSRENPPKLGDVFIIKWGDNVPAEIVLVVDVSSKYDDQDECWVGHVLTPVGKFRFEWMFAKDEWL